MEKSEINHKNLDRALDLLVLLSNSAAPMNVMEISKALNITRTTTYAMLNSLQKRKFVEREADTGKYCIGYGVLELAASYQHQYPFLYVAEKYIVSLAQKWSIKVNVSVYKSPGVSLLLVSKDTNNLVPRMVIGHVMPAYATASGKLLMASLPEERLKADLEEITFRPYTPNTICQAEAFKEELDLIRQRDYAIELEELMPQHACVAAPIRNRAGQCIASISFSGTLDIIKTNMAALVNDICLAGGQISAELGYNYLTMISKN